MSTRRANHAVAVGLRYRDGKADTPAVEVKGEALLADQIVRLARRYGVPVIEDRELAKALHSVELDHEIPPSLFKPVAIILNALKKVFS